MRKEVFYTFSIGERGDGKRKKNANKLVSAERLKVKVIAEFSMLCYSIRELKVICKIWLL